MYTEFMNKDRKSLFTDADLFEAFAAGFEYSGEGFNGEYVNQLLRQPGALDERLRGGFEWWRAESKRQRKAPNP